MPGLSTVEPSYMVFSATKLNVAQVSITSLLTPINIMSVPTTGSIVRTSRAGQESDGCVYPTWFCRGQRAGHRIWLVSFMDYDLGYFDEEEARVEPGPNPFVPAV